MKTTTKKKPPAKRSKGKQHPARAESFDKIANDVTKQNRGVGLTSLKMFAIALRNEARRLRTILR